MSIWNSPEDTDIVEYIIIIMKMEAKPDGLRLVEINILNMQDKGLCYRLLTAINGQKPRRIIEDLTWNWTVNLKDGAGRNKEIDIVNELLDREFKGKLKEKYR